MQLNLCSKVSNGSLKKVLRELFERSNMLYLRSNVGKRVNARSNKMQPIHSASILRKLVFIYILQE